MDFSKTEKTAYDLALPVAAALGYEIYDVEYVKEGPHWFLRVFISRPEGVDIDDCETISRELSQMLDKKDCIQNNYFLEVSSPGIERNLRQKEHFEDAVGSRVKIKLYKPVDGVKEAEGELLSAEDDKIAIKAGDRRFEIDKKNIAKANILFDF